jgi:hypothetical protein
MIERHETDVMTAPYTPPVAWVGLCLLTSQSWLRLVAFSHAERQQVNEPLTDAPVLWSVPVNVPCFRPPLSVSVLGKRV